MEEFVRWEDEMSNETTIDGSVHVEVYGDAERYLERIASAAERIADALEKSNQAADEAMVQSAVARATFDENIRCQKKLQLAGQSATTVGNDYMKQAVRMIALPVKA